jgi:hypothetical protein
VAEVLALTRTRPGLGYAGRPMQMCLACSRVMGLNSGTWLKGYNSMALHYLRLTDPWIPCYYGQQARDYELYMRAVTRLLDGTRPSRGPVTAAWGFGCQMLRASSLLRPAPLLLYYHCQG